ncbi:MAG TPA: sigma-70 family RNA polymerase sigma factor [Candidatus Limnocylindrales bacterium]|jgi:RNA polymerase sigma-70 factor (ECF subfamily)
MTEPSTETGDDAALVARIAMGDEAALAEAYDRHAGLLFGSTVRFLGDREAAAEVTQDAFMALWRRATQFDPRAGSLSAWLLGIARHRAIDRFRAEARRAASRSIPLSALVGGDRDDAGGSGGDELPTWRLTEEASEALVRDPATVADRRWLQAVIRTVVSELPEVERSVVLLAYSGGLSQSEIAARIGAPIGTVKSRTRRAFARLRANLATVPGLLDVVDGMVIGGSDRHLDEA